ncbi:hypothetical protein MBLNU230_g5319t1 [Neophaeotheca triangularis]
MPPTTPTTVSASYKKKDGNLTVSADGKSLSFRPLQPPGGPATVNIAVTDITNLQQTPEPAPKQALKVFVGEASHVFTFTHKTNARKEIAAVTDILRSSIAAAKASTAAQVLPKNTHSPAPSTGNGDSTGAPAAMAIAKAVASKDEGWYDDNKLKNDISLQQSLLRSDKAKALRERFNQSLRDKPESVSAAQFTTQFWATRLHLLRAHAIEQAQQMGEYNVLPEIAFVRKRAEKEGDPDIRQLNITREQIKLIFKQYPVVSEAFNAHVPPMDAAQFWQRFFSSKLLKKLKGEKITQQDPSDPVLDKYLDSREAGPRDFGHVPNFIDLEGNEQNHSQRKGNRPDETMRASNNEKVPILRVLNNLSEKMLSRVAAEDGEAHAPIGMDEDSYEQLRLRDLALEDKDNRVVLNIREQQRLQGGNRDDLSAEALQYSKQDPTTVLNSLRASLQPSNLGADARTGTLRLDRAIGFNPDNDSDDNPSDDGEADPQATKTAPKTGTPASMTTATTTIFTSITAHRDSTTNPLDTLRGLSPQTFQTLTTTANTTTEFLHYFWTLFHSGDSSKVPELQNLVATLDRSVDRLDAVAEQAENERRNRIDALKAKVKAFEQKSGKRRRVDYEGEVGGGRRIVEELAGPVRGALRRAVQVYRGEFERQTREVAAAASAGAGAGAGGGGTPVAGGGDVVMVG